MNNVLNERLSEILSTGQVTFETTRTVADRIEQQEGRFIHYVRPIESLMEGPLPVIGICRVIVARVANQLLCEGLIERVEFVIDEQGHYAALVDDPEGKRYLLNPGEPIPVPVAIPLGGQTSTDFFKTKRVGSAKPYTYRADKLQEREQGSIGFMGFDDRDRSTGMRIFSHLNQVDELDRFRKGYLAETDYFQVHYDPNQGRYRKVNPPKSELNPLQVLAKQKPGNIEFQLLDHL